MKEKAGCGNLPQLAEFVRLATPLARFGKVVRTASKQRVGSSSLPGRAIFSNTCGQAEKQYSYTVAETVAAGSHLRLAPLVRWRKSSISMEASAGSSF